MVARTAAALAGIVGLFISAFGASSSTGGDPPALTAGTEPEVSSTMTSDEPVEFAEIIDHSELPSLGAPDVASGDIEAVGRYGAEHADTFAGTLLAGGRLWVGFTSDHERHLSAARAVVSKPGQLGVFRARFAMAELRQLQQRISHDTTALAAEGIRVSLVAVEVRKNRVVIGVENAEDAAVVEALRRRYPPDQIEVNAGVVMRPAVGGADGR